MALTITIPGAVEATIGATAPAVLTVGVGTPGATGPAGPAGQGVPVGGTAGQFLTKIDGTNYNTDWTTVNLSVYAVKANNLSDLASASTARTNLGLGYLAVVNDAPSDGSQYARKNAAWEVVTTTPDFISSVSSPLAVTTGNLSIDLSAYAPLASPVFTGDARAVTPTFGDDDTSIATTAFVQAGLLGGTAVARNLEVEVRNQSGSSIAAGSIVYISGATGNKPLITLSQANNDANSAQTMGFVKTTIANNGTGYVIVRGVLENIDTSALTEGVQLYLSPTTAGTWTTTKPYAPSHMVYVGIVIRSHPTLGTILVAVQNGLELEELHDVSAQTPANLDLLSYESSTSLWKNKTFSALGLLTSATASSTYAPIASPALTGNVTITSNSAGAALFIEQSGAGNILTLHDQASDTSFVTIDANGKVSTIPSTTANAGFNIAHGAAPSAPSDGDIWSTTTGLFMRQSGVTKQYVDFDSTQTINGVKTFSNSTSTFGSSTATGTIGLASGATISGSTKTVNIGTAGVSGSTTNITIGTSTGNSSTTVNGVLTANGTQVTVGNNTAASTINVGNGATISGATKAVNIGTAGVAGSTTNITIGSTTGTSTTTLQGTTNGITAAADTNSVALATTAFVVGQAGSATPIVDGTAAVGTSLRYARQDHVHPTDTSRAPLASPSLTGTPLSTTAAVDTNTTQIATTAFVVGQAYAKQASPGLTGTPTAPTATAGTNTTQIATTAFVTAAVPVIATFAESQQLTSTTKVMSPFDVLTAMMTEGYRPALGMTGGSTGAGAGVNPIMPQYMGIGGPNTLTAGNCYAITNNNGGYSTASSSVQTIKWDKPVCISGTFNLGGTSVGDANNEFKAFLGTQMLNGDDPTSASIGLWKQGGTTPISVMVHNGTTLTKVASSASYGGTNPIRYMVYSDGAGNVTLYINGTSVATTASGPTGATQTNTGQFTASIKQTASAVTRLYIELVHPKIFVAPQ